MNTTNEVLSQSPSTQTSLPFKKNYILYESNQKRMSTNLVCLLFVGFIIIVGLILFLLASVLPAVKMPAGGEGRVNAGRQTKVLLESFLYNA